MIVARAPALAARAQAARDRKTLAQIALVGLLPAVGAAVELAALAEDVAAVQPAGDQGSQVR